MNKLSKVAFVFLCIGAFALSGILSYKTAYKNRTESPYRYLKVKEDPSVWTVEHDLLSDGKASTTYDLYLPATVEPGKSYSMIFFIHGGGFTTGDKADGKRLCPYYASKGMVAVSANYSLAAGEDPANLNTMYDELRNTVSCAVEYCESKGYHVTEMATTGESAGGGLALLLAYREPDESPIPVRFAFVQSAPVNFDPTEWGFTEQQDLADFVTKMSGVPCKISDIGSEHYQEAINSISPSAWVTTDSVPCILGYGPRDIIVPPTLKTKLLEKLDEFGVTYRYIEFPNSGHGLLHDFDRSDEYYRLVDEYIKTYFENR